MTKKEKTLYKSGRKNPDGYRFNPLYLFNNKWIPIVISVLIPFSIIFSLFDLFNITSWNRLFSTIDIVDGISPQDSNFAVYYLDVGQSDCTIIVCDDEVMMIDTGTVNQVYNIRTSLYSLEIDKIDYMVITHQHDDHMSGAAEIIEHYKVSNILMPQLSDTEVVNSQTYFNLLKKISDYSVNPVPISAGYSFNLGSSIIEVLSPSIIDDNLNNMSAVLKITYGETKFLFQGDSDSKIEKQLLKSDFDLSANVIKIGHHGSNTSSYGAFLDAVNPECAIVSCNSDNNYGHPNTYVIERLEERNIKPYITSLNGDITVVSDGKNVFASSLK